MDIESFKSKVDKYSGYFSSIQGNSLRKLLDGIQNKDDVYGRRNYLDITLQTLQRHFDKNQTLYRTHVEDIGSELYAFGKAIIEAYTSVNKFDMSEDEFEKLSSSFDSYEKMFDKFFWLRVGQDD